MECDFCNKFKFSILIDNEKNEKFPREVEAFLVLTQGGEIKQCPNCYTYYRYESVTDNEVGCERHTEELRKISSAVAQEIILDEKLEDEEYKKAINKFFGETIKTLSESERLVFDLISEKRWAGACLSTIKEKFSHIDNLQKILETFVERKIVIQRITHSLFLGKSGFQETDPTVYEFNVYYQANLSYFDFQKKLEKRRKKSMKKA